MAAPSITIFVRHSADCASRLEGEFFKRCNCRKHLRWFHNGSQHRQSAKTRSWSQAEVERRRLEAQFDAGNNAPTVESNHKTVEQAIKLFLNNKRGENLAADSLYRHEHITGQLLEFCNREGVPFIKDVTLAHLTTWRGQWTLKSPQARRSCQEKVRNFFKFCLGSGMIATNPAAQMSAIKVRHDDINIRALSTTEYEKIIASVDKTTMTPQNAARIKSLMQLQRWSGLSLVDAVCLSKDELQQNGDVFRVVMDRQKTGTHINNVIPTWLGQELLKVKNGNPEFFFWSGNSTPEDAPSNFHKLYRKVFKAAGVEGSSHDLRHTFAIELLKAGVEIRAVSKALGHSSVTVTERYYSKWCKGQQIILDDALVTAWEKK